MATLPRHRDEGGTTLVEILVAVVVLGSAVVSLVLGLGSMATRSDGHRRMATADTIARSYAEALKLTISQNPGYWCSTSPYSVSATIYAVPSGYTVTQTPQPCPANGPQVQSVKINVTDTLPVHRANVNTVVEVRQP